MGGEGFTRLVDDADYVGSTKGACGVGGTERTKAA